jgi:hypothetical protein
MCSHMADLVSRCGLPGLLILRALPAYRPTVPPSESYARRKANAALVEYRTREGLPPSAFGSLAVTAEGRYLGVFNYTSGTRPRLPVRVDVDSSARAERHRLVE